MVALGDVPWLFCRSFSSPHLLQTKHGVEFAWPPIVTDFVVHVWLGAKAAMVPKRSGSLVELVVVRGNHSALAGGEDLGREE